jgi:sulfite reductase (NADPH) flavoprotein alpha-component
MVDMVGDVVASLGGPPRIAAAGGVVALYASLCMGLFAARRRQRARMAMRATSAGGEPSDAILVAFSSQTGTAEELATQTADHLRAGGQPVRLVSFADLERLALHETSRALFVVSTTGEGDAPDDAARVQRQMSAPGWPLDGLRYGVLALGDRSYQRYCAFGFAFDAWLRDQRAVPLFETIDVDDSSPLALARWRAEVAAICRQPDAGPWKAAPFGRWRLVERRVLNAGSPGGPAYHVALAMPDADVRWRPGDIAEIVPGTAATDVPPPGPVTREYSIASLPDDGRVELLVRQVRRDDGTLGLGSGWLTANAPIGGEVWLRIRPNRAFHPPDPERPLVLIGNGTGLAGLRAHVKARAKIRRHRNWLLFGERTPAHDVFHRDEIHAWLSEGVLERCDLAFSRSQQPLYVQDLLRRERNAIRRWADDGAAFYVCGSRAGMAEGVDAALASILGSRPLEELRAEGRYRRDVY